MTGYLLGAGFTSHATRDGYAIAGFALVVVILLLVAAIHRSSR